MKKRRIISAFLALLLLASLPMSVLAAGWDIGNGDITVNAGSGGQTVTQGSQIDVPDSAPVIAGSSTDNTVTIHVEKDQTANVSLSGVNINVSRKYNKTAVSTNGEGNVSIELDGNSTLKSAEGHAGLEKNNGGSLTIADKDRNGKLTADGGKYGAGIGGGNEGNGNNLAVTGGEVKATGGYGGAGIGGGNNGGGSGITISGDAKVNAQGGDQSGAGIGGGKNGAGNDITISGGEVNAIGGNYGAGIGGGDNGDGIGITISGDAQVNAQGGDGGAGIGGGYEGNGKNIEITGGKVEATGGRQAAGIGGGGSRLKGSSGGNPIPGAEVEPDISGLTTGWIEYYAPGADMGKDKPRSTTVGTHPPQEKPVEHNVPEQPEAERGMDVPLYRVTGKDGRDIAYTAEQKGSVLTITVDADIAVLTGRLSGVHTLKAQGVEKIIFVTKDAASEFLLSDLLGKCESGEAYRLTHDGKAVTFILLGENMADVSAILIKP